MVKNSRNVITLAPKKRLSIILLPLLAIMTIPFAQATTITACTFDRDTYNQGEAGYITVTLYNDEDVKIRVTELTATINYYYSDGSVYIQKFYTNATTPTEILQGNSSTFHIEFDLPINIASGYTNVHVKALTEIWNPMSELWFGSEHPTYQPTLYIESPYKEQLEEQQTINDQLEGQLEEQQTINDQLEGQLEEQQTINDQLQTTNDQLEGQLEEQQTINENATTMIYLLGATAVVFAAVTVFLFIINRRMRVFTQPIA